MNAARLCLILKMLVRVSMMILVLLTAALGGVTGIVMFVFAGRVDWGVAFFLAPVVMLSVDSEELHFEFRHLERRAGHE